MASFDKRIRSFLIRFRFPLTVFVVWRVLLFAIIFFGLLYFPLQDNFLGGGKATYLKNPFFWSWLNFDGEHYLEITRRGYQPLTYFFFPLYPLLIRLTAFLGGFRNPSFYAISGLTISNLSFLIGLIGFYKLVKLDYSEKIANLSLILLLVFPTSFFFGSFYTEGLFLALSVWALYFARKKNFFFSAVLVGLATATRVVGIALIPAILIEAWPFIVRRPLRVPPLKVIFSILIAPAGLLAYMYFLKVRTGDPLEFFNTIGIFGPQREAGFVFLPQVFYRYIFKILPNLNYSALLGFYTPVLELTSAFLFLGLTIVSLFKLRLSYSIYMLIAYLIPTLSGSFSSFPRYVLILFPAFMVAANYLSRKSLYFRLVIYLILILNLFICLALFSRGYWIA